MSWILSRLSNLRKKFDHIDPRIPVAVVLFSYLVLGLTILGFNRSPMQIAITTSAAMVFETFLTRFFKKIWIFPLSAMITSFSLSFLLNYSHDYFLLFVPVFFAIGSKYLFTVNGRHALNPAMVGVSFSLLFSNELITASPAYQWNGLPAMSIYILTLGLFFVVLKVQRSWLIGSFLLIFSLQTALRALIMRHHLPFETLFLGTLSSPPFYIFTFFMITDPPTSPDKKKDQIIVGTSLALVDLALHLRQSYYTFFYAALIVGSTRFIWKHIQLYKAEGFHQYFLKRFLASKYYYRPLILGGLVLVSTGFYHWQIYPNLPRSNIPWTFEKVFPQVSGLNANKKGDIYELVDPRIQHAVKWILSVGDSVALGDVDGDGRQDIFLTNMLKTADQRAALYRNMGNHHFERFPIPALDEYVHHPEIHGVISNVMFVDYDNSGAQSIFLTVGFGHPILLKNMIKETKRLEFKDVSEEVGLTKLYTNSLSATFADFNKDGLLDLLILNVWPENLPDYQDRKKLNLFHLPQPEYAGDERPFNFMHASWHMANNGGKNLLLLQTKDHKFTLQNSDEWGLPETRWSLAVGVADFNHDGWPDIYIANDFGPDDLYYNRDGNKFENIKGTIFGSIGRDTYKGMNVSIADYDRTGWYGVYVSNVHHALQAEGSLLWMFEPTTKPHEPEIVERASQKNVLNENRFGWGAVAADFNNDGWIDLAQANGMIDDSWDKKYEQCPDYWYVNEKVARSPPSIHRYANHWGDLRGMCIYGKEQNRIYLNRGLENRPQFVDMATELGVTEMTNSRGVAAADFENQGRMDLIFTHQFSEPTLYKNKYTSDVIDPNNWIGVVLQSKNEKCNREAIGSKVTVKVTKNNDEIFQLTQETQVVSGFSAQSDKRLRFGLGASVKSFQVMVNWCYGIKQEIFDDLKLNQYNALTLTEEIDQ